MGFDLARMAGVEFAVDQRVKQDFGLVAGHFGCSCSAIHADRSMARARARRDITVPTGTSDDIGDLAVRKIVDFTQHEGLPERFGERRDQPPDRGGVARAQHLRLRRFLRFVPQRRLLGVLGHVVDGAGRRAGAPRKFGAADIAQDREQPWLHRRPAIAVEMFQRAQVAFLHRVLGVGGVAQQIARQRIDVVEMRQRGVAKTPRLLGIVVRER